MPEKIANSDIIQKLLVTILDVSIRKTNSGFAISSMNDIIQHLRNQYSFFEFITVQDNRYIEDETKIFINKDINSISTDNLGPALNDCISMMYQTLGDQAGHFFMREVQKKIGDTYSSTIKAIGIDLSLLQLENEVTKKLK